MSQPENAHELEGCEFKWGQKKGKGGKKKEVQFYGSFMYDGTEYFLYDSVFLYKEGEPMPYIGKLVKIWEQPPKKKKVKVLWFFHPDEVCNWLEGGTTLKNELFLASGDGRGLTNVNPLEAIAGKCNVVCTSRDSRNPQPSPEELRMADYVFYRSFDVGNCTISDKIDDKIAGIEVTCLYNRVGTQLSNGGSELGPTNKEGNEGVMASNQVSKVCPMINDKFGTLTENEVEDSRVTVVNEDHLGRENSVSGLCVGTIETEASAVSLHGKITSRTLRDSHADEDITGSISTSKGGHKLKSTDDLGVLGDRLSKKAKRDSSAKSPEEPSVTHPSAVKSKNGPVPRKIHNSDTNDTDMLQASQKAGSAYDEKTNSKPCNDLPNLDKGSQKRVKLDEKASKLSNGTSSKATSAPPPEKNIIPEGQELEVTRKPETDRSKWFVQPPWEERMQTAYGQGTLVQLENLDPEYSSTEIEDIIWSGFRESCTAKVVPQTAMSSPHSGQAFVIFKTRDAADTAVRKLDEGCLILPNGRPLVASWGTSPSSAGKSTTFLGHLVIDKIKSRTHREEQESISTSHCSQPNTIEYDMAMEWCLLQTRSDSMWEDMYKRHGDELKKLKASLKSK